MGGMLLISYNAKLIHSPPKKYNHQSNDKVSVRWPFWISPPTQTDRQTDR